MDDVSVVLREIEYLRQKLNQIAIEKGISNSKVIRISKQLDEVLNEYQKMITKE